MTALSELPHPPGICPSHRELYGRLHAVYETVYSRLRESEVPPVTIDSSPNEGTEPQPLLSLHRPVLPGDLVSEVAVQVCQALMRLENADRDALEHLVRETRAGDLCAQELVMLRLTGEEPPDVGVPTEVLDTVVIYTARPFLKWMAGRIQGLGEFLESWREGSCPVCGARPELGRLARDDGRRMLWCWLCATEWRFARLSCPYCSTEHPDGQRYFVVEETPYRVDVCDACGRYLKVVDERRLPGEETVELSWVVNDLTTRHLDELALREGYESPG